VSSCRKYTNLQILYTFPWRRFALTNYFVHATAWKNVQASTKLERKQEFPLWFKLILTIRSSQGLWMMGRRCAACILGDHNVPRTSEPLSGTMHSSEPGMPSRRYGGCSPPAQARECSVLISHHQLIILKGMPNAFDVKATSNVLSSVLSRVFRGLYPRWTRYWFKFVWTSL